MTDEQLLDFLRRVLAAQHAVDAVISAEQQAREQQADGSYRVKCASCGKSVSNPLPVAVVLRAHVQCPECIAEPNRGDDLGVDQ